MFRARPNARADPDLPERGVKTDLAWMRAGTLAAEVDNLEKTNTDRPVVQEFFGIQARNLAKPSAAGVRITVGTDGNRPLRARTRKWRTWSSRA